MTLPRIQICKSYFPNTTMPPVKQLTEHIGRLHVTKVCNKIFSIVSVITVPIIFGAVLMMALQDPGVHAVSMLNIPVLHLDGDNKRYVTPQLQLDMKVLKAHYVAVLKDSKGDAVYTWPTIVMDRPDHLLGPALSYKIPKLPAGEYTLAVHIEYLVNPLSGGNLDIVLAKLYISE